MQQTQLARHTDLVPQIPAFDDLPIVHADIPWIRNFRFVGGMPKPSPVWVAVTVHRANAVSPSWTT